MMSLTAILMFLSPTSNAMTRMKLHRRCLHSLYNPRPEASLKSKSACAVPLLSSVLEQIESLFRVPEYRRLCFLQGIQSEKDTASGCNWRAMVKVVCVVWLMLSAVPAGAQWLTLRTPGLPRTPDGKVNLSAPAPRTAEGKPDLTGYWTPA